MRVKKNIERNKPRSKKKENENRKETHEVAYDQKLSGNDINESQTEDAEEQKKRKRKRKRRNQKDLDTTSQNKKEPQKQQNSLPPLVSGDSTEITGNSKIRQKETTYAIKKEKTAKARTKASAKKTIEGLNSDESKSIENFENSRDSKMGEKGWWDR